MLAKKKLTRKEIECLMLAAQDLSTKETSQKVHRTIGTIKKHRMTLLNKLGCHTMAGAVMIGVKMGLFENGFISESNLD